MRLDHIAYRTKDRKKTAEFFIKAFGYKVQTEFEPIFGDGTSQGVKCIALEPPEKVSLNCPWVHTYFGDDEGVDRKRIGRDTDYHMPPEIFISDGPPESIVGKWIAGRDGIGGIHHLAYQVDSVQETMNEWKEKGYAEFLSDKPLTCPDLTQVFTSPHALTGVIFEFIERGKHGFCAENVANLMMSTEKCK